MGRRRRDGASGKDAATLARFYDELGPDRCAQLQAVILDLGGAYAKATRQHAPQAVQAADPFHVIALANKAIDQTRRWAWNLHRTLGSGRAKWVKATRWALVKDPADWHDSQREVMARLKRDRSVLYRAWLLTEALRDLYRLDAPTDAPGLLDRWIASACRSRIPAFVKLSRTVRKERDRILAAIKLSLSNSKPEASTPKSGSSTIAATATTPPHHSSP